MKIVLLNDIQKGFPEEIPVNFRFQCIKSVADQLHVAGLHSDPVENFFDYRESMSFPACEPRTRLYCIRFLLLPPAHGILQHGRKNNGSNGNRLEEKG